MASATCNYSAQNRMGGYNRETVYMGLLFDDSKWTYSTSSWNVFSKDLSTIMAKTRELNAVHITSPDDLKP